MTLVVIFKNGQKVTFENVVSMYIDDDKNVDFVSSIPIKKNGEAYTITGRFNINDAYIYYTSRREEMPY